MSPSQWEDEGPDKDKQGTSISCASAAYMTVLYNLKMLPFFSPFVSFFPS